MVERRRRHVHAEHLRQPCHPTVDHGTRFGKQHYRVAPVGEIGVAKPIVHDTDPLHLPIVERR